MNFSLRGRWPVALDTPKDQWTGYFGMVIPDSVKTLPIFKNPDSLQVGIQKWQYGLVAEILHLGPYSSEASTLKKLTDYIDQQGYTIAGEHEEEYLKGPGMFGPGNPEKYMTIIRYRVKKKAID